MQTTIYSGGNGGRWFTEDPDHAAYFGEVSSRELDCPDERILHARPEDVQQHFENEMGGRGMPMAGDDAECLKDMADLEAFKNSRRIDWICLHDWEGSGLCFFRV